MENQKDNNTWYPESVKPGHDSEVKGVRYWREKPRRENHG